MRIVAAALGAAMLFVVADPTLAQGADPKADEARPNRRRQGRQKKIDEFAEAERLLGGPAANPECVWLGRRVVSLLWKDDLDTAFRHLDLYDRFGCPSGHIQVDLPLPGPAGRHRSEGDRHAQQPRPCLLGQSELRGEGHGGCARALPPHRVVCTNVQDRAR